MSDGATFESIDSLDPLYVEIGAVLPVIEESDTRYSFERLRLPEMEIVKVLPGMSKDGKWIGPKINQLLAIETLAGCGYSSEAKTGRLVLDGKYVRDAYGKYVKVTGSYTDLPCCDITPNGTLIPQLLCNWNIGRNEADLSSKISASDASTAYSNGKTLWKLTKPSGPKSGVTNFTNRIEHHISQTDCFPTIDSTELTMIGFKDEFDDRSTGSFNRKFQTSIKSHGAYALLMEFHVAGSTYDCKMGNSTITFSGSSSKQDTISATFHPNGGISTKLNKKNSANGNFKPGSIFPTPYSYQVGQNHGPVVFFYNILNSTIITGDPVTLSINQQNAVNLRKKYDLDLAEIVDPPYSELPGEYKSSTVATKRGLDVGGKLSDKKEIYPNFEENISLEWENSWGSFSLMPISFVPKVKFSFYFRISGQDMFNRETGSSSSGKDLEDTEIFILEYSFCPEGKTDWQSKIKNYSSAKPEYLSFDKDKQSSLYRVDFEIEKNSPSLSAKFPFEIHGIIRVSKRTGKITQVKNGNGDFSTNFINKNSDLGRPYLDYVKNAPGNAGLVFSTEIPSWSKFITSVQVSHTLDGSHGTLVLDKMGMMEELGEFPNQVIGALTLVAKNGFYKSRTETINGQEVSISASSNYAGRSANGTIFKGFATKITESSSDGSNSLQLNLVGINQKLEDMTLVNCPFWDGDKLDDVLKYMRSYSGCQIIRNSTFSNGATANSIILPKSADWKSPAVNFVLGTRVKDALIELGKFTSHRFVIQPNGCGYYYSLNDYGAPDWIYSASPKISYSYSDIISMNLEPSLENRYNTFLTMALLGNRNTKGEIGIEDTSPGYEFTLIGGADNESMPDSSNYPWSKIITNKENGIVTRKELKERHRTNVKFGQADIFSGSITVPGYDDFFIFDVISIEGTKYYIIGISHNLNLQTKEWTTSLNLGRYVAKTETSGGLNISSP